MNKICFFLLLLFLNKSYSQLTFSIADIEKAAQRTLMSAALIGENVLLRDQKSLIDEMTDLEKQYQDKMAVNRTARALPFFAAVVTANELTNAKLNTMSSDLESLKAIPKSLKYGFFKAQNDIDKYKRELSRIRGDYLTYAGGVIASNGLGDVQASLVKLSMRALTLRNNVLETELKVNNLLTLNRFSASLLKSKL